MPAAAKAVFEAAAALASAAVLVLDKACSFVSFSLVCVSVEPPRGVIVGHIEL
jgi:hypothetical protein